MKPLTDRQAEVVGFIKSFFLEHGYWPSMREIAAHFGVNLNAAAGFISGARKKGELSWPENVARAFVITGYKVDLVPISGTQAQLDQRNHIGGC